MTNTLEHFKELTLSRDSWARVIADYVAEGGDPTDGILVKFVANYRAATAEWTAWQVEAGWLVVGS